MTKKTTKSLDEILAEIRKTQGEDYLLVLRPEGNGSLAIENKDNSDKKYTNIMFDSIESLISPNKVYH